MLVEEFFEAPRSEDTLGPLSRMIERLMQNATQQLEMIVTLGAHAQLPADRDTQHEHRLSLKVLLENATCQISAVNHFRNLLLPASVRLRAVVDASDNDEPSNHEPANHEPANHEPANHEPANHEPANHGLPLHSGTRDRPHPQHSLPRFAYNTRGASSHMTDPSGHQGSAGGLSHPTTEAPSSSTRFAHVDFAPNSETPHTAKRKHYKERLRPDAKGVDTCPYCHHRGSGSRSSSGVVYYYCRNAACPNTQHDRYLGWRPIHAGL